MSSDGPLDSIRNPATALLVEQGDHLPLGRPGVVSLAAVTKRAQRIATHAMKIGDPPTAALLAEAFARLAMYSPSAPGATLSQSSTQEHAALRRAAISLIQCAHPDAWADSELATDATCAVHIDLSDLCQPKTSHQGIDDELAELLGMVSSCEEAT